MIHLVKDTPANRWSIIRALKERAARRTKCLSYQATGIRTHSSTRSPRTQRTYRYTDINTVHTHSPPSRARRNNLSIRHQSLAARIIRESPHRRLSYFGRSSHIRISSNQRTIHGSRHNSIATGINSRPQSQYLHLNIRNTHNFIRSRRPKTNMRNAYSPRPLPLATARSSTILASSNIRTISAQFRRLNRVHPNGHLPRRFIISDILKRPSDSIITSHSLGR